MRYYQVLKVKAGGSLETVGTYEGGTPQEAIDKMAERGNLSGNEWAMQYIAIPEYQYFRRYIPKVK